MPLALWKSPMPNRTPLRGSAVVEIVSIDWVEFGWSTKLIRSIFFDRSNARYSATHGGVGSPGVTGLNTALTSHGPNATEEFLKLPPASAKNPTVFRPPTHEAGVRDDRAAAAVRRRVVRQPDRATALAGHVRGVDEVRAVGVARPDHRLGRLLRLHVTRAGVLAEPARRRRVRVDPAQAVAAGVPVVAAVGRLQPHPVERERHALRRTGRRGPPGRSTAGQRR